MFLRLFLRWADQRERTEILRWSDKYAAGKQDHTCCYSLPLGFTTGELQAPLKH